MTLCGLFGLRGSSDGDFAVGQSGEGIDSVAIHRAEQDESARVAEVFVEKGKVSPRGVVGERAHVGIATRGRVARVEFAR